MNSRTFAITLFTAMTVQVPAHAGEIQFTPLTVPNQVQDGGSAINDLGVAVGIYEGANGVRYGFVSTPPYSNESFTTVAAAGIPHTNLWGITLEGTVTGNSIDVSGVYHGSVSQPPYSTVTLFDAPDACSSGTCLGTTVGSINLKGLIAGYYSDANGVNHGYVTHPPYTESTFTTINAPGACSSGMRCSGLGTEINTFALNDLGAVTGYYLDKDGVAHGFVSYPPYTKTTLTTFDAPGARSSDRNSLCPGEGTYPESINLFGVITGTYYDAEGVGHGFVSYPPYTRTTFTSFDAAGSIDTLPSSINLEGVVVGYFSDASGVNHGFVSHPPYTTVTPFDAPHACSSDSNPACSGNGTVAYGINVEGMFTGYAADATGHRHGFVAQQYGHPKSLGWTAQP